MAQGERAPRRLIIGISGATGAAYGIALLKRLQAERGWESHLVLTDAGALNVWQELGLRRKEVERLADAAYSPRDIGAAIASGSYLSEGMVIAPCSMKTLAAVAHAHADDLVSRAADVVLKERRPLILVPRETPYSMIHLENMLRLTRAGAVVLPASPGFYHRPTSMQELIDFVVGRILQHIGLDPSVGPRWRSGEPDA